MGIVLDAGAEDLKQSGDTFEITCDPTAFGQVKEALEKAGIKPTEAAISQVPKTPRDVEPETGARILKLMDAIDDHDDVQNVYSDLNVTEAIVAEASKE